MKTTRKVMIGRIIGALSASPFGVYCGAVLGTFGGAWGESFFGRPGVLVGAVLVSVSVAGAFLAVGAIAGGMIAAAIFESGR
jgi:hypothetical protein